MIELFSSLYIEIVTFLKNFILPGGDMHNIALLLMCSMIPLFSTLSVIGNTIISKYRMISLIGAFPKIIDTLFYKLFINGVRKTRFYKYIIPILVLSSLNIFMSMILLDGHRWTDQMIFTGRRVFLLCGDNCWADKQVPHIDVSLYQTQTVGVLSYAFLGWMVWTLTVIFDRAASHHLFPATFNRLILRLVVALLIAVPVRHLTHGLAGAAQLTGVVLAFCVGMFPERGLKLITDVFDRMVRSENRSEDFDLEWIEGIDGALTFRLRELNITNAHDMAVANPFSIAEAIAQPLSGVVDWIAQAKLLVLLKSEKMKKLRDCGIRTIFDLVGILETGNGRDYLKTQCGWDILEGYNPVDAIKSDGEYKRLLEVYLALGSDPPGAKPSAP